MIASDTLLSQTRNGFQRLDVPDPYKESALKWLTHWITEPAFKDYRPQIEYLIETEHWDFLLDAFLPNHSLRHRGPARPGGHWPQPDQPLDYPVLGPGSRPISEKAIRG